MTTYQKPGRWNDERKDFDPPAPSSSSSSGISGIVLRKDGLPKGTITDLDILNTGASAWVSGSRGFVDIPSGAVRHLTVPTGAVTGTPYLWGDNGSGQLGTGGGAEVSPAVLSAMAGAVSVSAGGNHSAAALATGAAYCWGAGGNGQNGVNSTGDNSTPVQVHGVADSGFLAGVKQVACGNFHTLFRLSDGSVYSCGDNFSGELGDNTTTERHVPVQVVGVGASGTLSGIVDVKAGNGHSIALGANGLVYTWGEGSNGQMGDGATGDHHAPIVVPGLTDVVAIEAGDEHSLALKSDGTLYAWGRNTHGQLGINSTSDSSSPAQVQGVGGTGYLTGVAAIAGGATHSMAALTSGDCYACGDNFSGELGDGTTTDALTPVQVVGVGGTGTLANISRVACSDSTSHALATDGTLYGWGYNAAGQVGDTTTTERHTPVVIGPVADVADIVGGLDHTILLGDSSTVTADYTATGDIIVAEREDDGSLPSVSQGVSMLELSRTQGLRSRPRGAGIEEVYIEDATTTQRGVALLAADGGTDAGTVVQGSDSRLAAAALLNPPAMEVLWG